MAVKIKWDSLREVGVFDDLKKIHNNLKAYPTAQHAMHAKNYITTTEKVKVDHP